MHKACHIYRDWSRHESWLAYLTWTRDMSHTWIHHVPYESVMSYASWLKSTWLVHDLFKMRFESCLKWMRRVSYEWGMTVTQINMTGTGWRRLIGSPKSQIIVHKEPLNIGLFCWKWPIKIRDPMSLRHPVYLVWTSHVTYMNEPCPTWMSLDTHEWDMSSISHINESCYTHECGTTVTEVDMTGIPYINESRHVHEWAVSNMNEYVTHINETYPVYLTWLSHVKRMNESCHWWWVMSHMNESWAIEVSHVSC